MTSRRAPGTGAPATPRAVTPLATLMALRVKGRATRAMVAASTRLTLEDADLALVGMVAAGHAAPAGDGFTVTPAGRIELRRLLAVEPIDRRALGARYGAFLACDVLLKAAITALQLANAAPREPRRASAGASSAALRHAGEAVRALAAELAAIVPRLASYAERLAAALVALDGGDARFVASPAVDSLHQVWFELHEDLLLTLGRERGA